MSYKSALFIFILGGCGSVLRWIISDFTQWPSIGVNILGSFLIGMFFTLLPTLFPENSIAPSVIIIGFLGGLTTFSTFSLELLKYSQNGDYFKLISYVLLSVCLSLFAAFLGFQSQKILGHFIIK